MSTEHLVLGETTDFITGQTVADTHDERARQTIAKFLIMEKGFLKSDIDSRISLPVEVDGRSGKVTVDFVTRINDKAFAVILFRPGSLVSRERITLAVARLLKPYVIPYAVITNAVDAQMMDSRTGKVIGKALNAIFSKDAAISECRNMKYDVLAEARREKERRILFALEVLTQKECDDYTCPR